MPLCGSCGTDNPDVARFCLACGKPLAAQAAEPDEERRVISVLFTDIVGSTATAELLDPEDVRARLVPYYTRARAELERFGGVVEKFIGDAVVAVFGAPVAHEDDPERAVRAALAVHDGIAELNDGDAWLDLSLRTAVHTGEAFVVLDVPATEGVGMAAGDVMNTAARLQSGAPVNGIVVGEDTYRATRASIEYRAAEPVQAKGKSEPIPIWEVIGVKEEQQSSAPVTTLVGREAEGERLDDAWRRVRTESRPLLAAVVGAPGIGKTRLLREFMSRAGDHGSVHCGRCLPYGEGITYWPLVEILKDAAGILRSEGREVTSTKLGALLDGLPTTDRDELRTMAAAVANVVGVPTTPRGTYSAEEISQAELHWGIRRTLDLLSADRAVVLVVEDLHWAEPTLLDLLHFLADGDRDAKLLVVGSGRPEVLDTPLLRGDGATSRLIQLDSLTRRDSELLLTELGGTELPRPLVERLLENAGGNPLFLEESVRMLVDEGHLTADGTVTTELEGLPVPKSLQALIGARLDSLEPGDRRIAQHAAVVGHVFWRGAVEELAGVDSRLDIALAELERRDLIRERTPSSVAGEREYAFKHILIRDVAYARLPKGRRTRLHLSFADWIEALPGQSDELVEIVAHHLEQSCLLAREIARAPIDPPVDRAVGALKRAAEKSERREGFREANGFYKRALAVADGSRPEAVAELRLRLGRTMVALGDLRRASDELSDVARVAGDLGRLDFRCAALVPLANVDEKQGRHAEAGERLAEAEQIASDLGDTRLQIEVGYELSNFHGWSEGAIERAVGDVQRALELAESLDDHAFRVEGHLRMGFFLYNLGKLAESEDQLDLCLALAADLGSHRDQARATFLLGRIRYYRGDVDDAERLAHQASEWFDRTGDTYLQIQNLRALGKYALAKGQPELAETRLREALPLALEAGGWVLIEIYRYMIESLLRQGNGDDAQRLAEFAARNLPEQDVYARATLLAAQALVSTERDERTAASSAFAEALRLFEAQQMHVDLGETRMAFAQALLRFDEDGAARTELERARAQFARMGADGMVERIDADLRQMRGGADSVGPPATS